MSMLTENPEVMLEALAALVRRAGGSVEISPDELPGPFNLLSKFDPDARKLYLAFDDMTGGTDFPSEPNAP